MEDITGLGTRIFLWSEIRYIQSENVYVNVVTATERVLVRMKLCDLVQKMPVSIFYQPHRSFLVNLLHVHSFDTKKIRMTDGREIPISRGKAAKFRLRMINFLSSS